MPNFYYVTIVWPSEHVWTETTNSMSDLTCVFDSQNTIVYLGSYENLKVWSDAEGLTFICHEGNFKSYVQSLAATEAATNSNTA